MYVVLHVGLATTCMLEKCPSHATQRSASSTLAKWQPAIWLSVHLNVTKVSNSILAKCLSQRVMWEKIGSISMLAKFVTLCWQSVYLHVGQGHLGLNCLHDLFPLLGGQIGQLVLIHYSNLRREWRPFKTQKEWTLYILLLIAARSFILNHFISDSDSCFILHYVENSLKVSKICTQDLKLKTSKLIPVHEDNKKA